MVGDRLPRSWYGLPQTALQRLFREESHLWFLTASSRYHLPHRKNWPPLWHHVVWQSIRWVPHWRDRCISSVFSPVGLNSQLCLVFKTYCSSSSGRSHNRWYFDQAASSCIVHQAVNWNRAWWWSMSGLRHCFVRVSFQPHCYALGILHHSWWNNMGDRMIDRILKLFRRGPQCCTLCFQVIDQHTSILGTVIIFNILQKRF